MAIKIELANKVVLLTGGYGYLGAEIAKSLAIHEAKVIVLARSKDKFDACFTEKDSNIFFQQGDISDTKSIQLAYKDCKSKYGQIDVLINNAFYLKGNSPKEMADEDFLYGLEGTLGSIQRCIREVLPYFSEQNAGNIINLSSMYGMVAPEFSVYENCIQFTNPPHYGAAKAGVIQLTKYYASLLGKENIRVNSVAPGPFPSEEVQKNQEFIDNLSKKTSLNRIGSPDELGGIFTFLASDASSYITGQNFVVDGGWTIK